jgi:hypothetical protein
VNLAISRDRGVDLSAFVSSLALSCGWLPEDNGKEPLLPVVADPHENPGFPSAPVRFFGVDPAKGIDGPQS